MPDTICITRMRCHGMFGRVFCFGSVTSCLSQAGLMTTGLPFGVALLFLLGCWTWFRMAPLRFVVSTLVMPQVDPITRKQQAANKAKLEAERKVSSFSNCDANVLRLNFPRNFSLSSSRFLPRETTFRRGLVCRLYVRRSTRTCLRLFIFVARTCLWRITLKHERVGLHHSSQQYWVEEAW